MKRIGIVKYLNAKPLVLGLENYPEFELIFDVPSKLAIMLAEGQLDIALIPSIQYFRFGKFHGGYNYKIVPNISISSKGKVLSVKLFCRKPILQIEKVALDTNSRTSVALVKIILKERFYLQPTFLQCDPTNVISWTDINADALLIIGDRAMQIDQAGGLPPHLNENLSIDLGEEWQKLTGLPFVYAFWTARLGERENLSISEVVAILQRTKLEGIKNISQIAASESQRIGIKKDFCDFYLRDVIHYDFGEEEIKGLMRFYDYARAMGLAPNGVELKFLTPSQEVK